MFSPAVRAVTKKSLHHFAKARPTMAMPQRLSRFSGVRSHTITTTTTRKTPILRQSTCSLVKPSPIIWPQRLTKYTSFCHKESHRFSSSAPALSQTQHIMGGAIGGLQLTQSNNNKGYKWALGAVLASIMAAGLHSVTGSQDDFYDYRFKTTKSPEDLASFYGGEEFMELFCIFPFVGHIMMRNGEFDEKGNVRTTGFPGTMIVSMVFSDDTNEDTGAVDWFNKRERFRNTLFGWTAWDMVSNFGFRTSEDGSIECYHYGEYFHGNLPVISQVALLIFKVHARWLAWSTEHHINHFAFTASTEEEEEMEEESRKNMPFFLLKHYVLSDLKALVFGRNRQLEDDDDSAEQTAHTDQTSFLVHRRRSSVARRGTDSADTTTTTTNPLLPVQDPAIKFLIGRDIAADRAAVQTILARHNTRSPGDVHAVLTRSYSLRKSPLAQLDEGEEEADKKQALDDFMTSRVASRRAGNTYSVATEAARVQHIARRSTLARMDSIHKKPEALAVVEDDGSYEEGKEKEERKDVVVRVGDGDDEKRTMIDSNGTGNSMLTQEDPNSTHTAATNANQTTTTTTTWTVTTNPHVSSSSSSVDMNVRGDQKESITAVVPRRPSILGA